MGRYYLHLQEGRRISYDPDGFDLPDPDAARDEAWRSARELCDDALAEGRDISRAAFLIVDEAGKLLGLVPLSSARSSVGQ
jgi:Domain of unknown function (DUF6894)